MNPATLTLLALASALAQLPASPDPKPVPLAGMVVDASGRPVANADVWLAEASRPPDEAGRFGTGALVVDPQRAGRGRPAGPRPRPDRCRGAIRARGTGRGRRAAFAAAPGPLGGGGPGRSDPRRLAPPAPHRPGRRPARADRAWVRRARASSSSWPRPEAGAGARVVPTRPGELTDPRAARASRLPPTPRRGARRDRGPGARRSGEVRVEAEGSARRRWRFQIPGFKILDNKKEAAEPIDHRAGAGRADRRADWSRRHGEPIRGVTVRAVSQVDGYAGSGAAGRPRSPATNRGGSDPGHRRGDASRSSWSSTRRGARPCAARHPTGLVVEAGRATEVAIPLRETVRSRGLVREDGTERPIPGVKIILNGSFGGDRFAMTDAEGRFAGRIFRDVNQPFGWPIRIPSPVLPAGRHGVAARSDAPARRRRAGLAADRAAARRGRPRDRRGRGRQARRRRRGRGDLVRLGRADPGGAGAHPTVPAASCSTASIPIAELNLTAWDGFAGSAAVTVRAADAAAAGPSP